MSNFKFINDDPDYRNLEDSIRYKNLYEEIGAVEANKKIKWRDEWMKYFSPNPNSTILELRSHNGPNLLKYSREKHQIDGVELSETLINTCLEALKTEPPEIIEKINIYNSRIEDFEIDKKYDYVLLTEILEHVTDPIKILQVAKKHLKKHGLIYIASPSTHWGNNTHVRGVPNKDLLKWLEQSNLSPTEIWEEDERTFCFCQHKVDYKIYGLLRVRNEEKIINDTLDHLSRFCTGGIFIYDDSSTDNTAIICQNHPSVKKVIKGEIWDNNRAKAEYENRAEILKQAQKVANNNDWFVYLDADERVEYDWSKLYRLKKDVVGVKMRLFDFYITPEDINEIYYKRKFLGPEYRDILIAFRNLPTLEYKYLDQREVSLGVEGKVINDGFVKHYGKAISIEEWEKTCEYYSKHFPMYSEKWEKRKGKAIHQKYSDFGNKLITWNEKELKGLDLYEFERNNKIENRSLKILITNHHLLDYRGSELFTLNLVQFLTSHGHNVTLYTKYIDDLAEVFEKMKVKVVTHLELIKDEYFDLAHVHHNMLALEVRYYFPRLPILFLSHGILPFLEQPPELKIGIDRYLAVSEEVKDNLISKGIESNRIDIFRNKIDPNEFIEYNPINKNPTNAIVISNKIDTKTEEIIKDACTSLNIGLEFIGKRFLTIPPKQVAEKINKSDIVFTLGRGVIETMMCGRIPIIFDVNGGDGIVSPENIKELMKKNFSGRTYNKKFSVDELIEEIKKYKYENGSLLKDISLKCFNYNAFEDIVEIYKDIISKKLETYYDAKLFNILEQFINSNSEIIYYQNNLKQKEINKIHFEQAEYLIQIGDLVKAKEILETLDDEGNLDVQNNLAVIAIMEERFPDALEIILYILRKNPMDEIALSNLQYLKSINVMRNEELNIHVNTDMVKPAVEIL